MSLLALGLNHHTAPVDIRERAVIDESRLQEALQNLHNLAAVNEATILSTCNRTEIYCGLTGPDASPVSNWVQEYLDISESVFTPHFFTHTDRNAVHHLMRVCSGLDSLVVGEPQILGQIKQAFRDADELGTVGSQLSPLFQTAFSVAKQVRTDTAIGNSPVSVAFAAVTLAKQIFADFSKHSALMIGAGDTVALAARHLKSHGIGQIDIVNRTLTRAQNLAATVNGDAYTLADLPSALTRADIIISSTGAPLPILGKGAMESAMRERRYRPLLIVDIAVPRDAEPQIGDIDGVFLYTVDDLHSVIEEGKQSRLAAANAAEEIIENQVEIYMQRLRALGATDTIRSYREQVQDTTAMLLQKSQKQLSLGQDPEQVLAQLARSLSNKIMHTPTQRMREAAQQGDNNLLNAAKSLFDLDTPDK
jgi:glutamyl-tRNA reductase